MKKTRFIPYGYTMRDGRAVIQHEEANIIRHIFSSYTKMVNSLSSSVGGMK